MAKQSAVAAKCETLAPQQGFQRFMINFKRDWQLHLMIFLPFFYIFLFDFVPLYGLQIAFKDYRSRSGIWGSEWVGLSNFFRFFRNYKWSQYVLNTVRISLYSIAAGFPIPIILALLLHVSEFNVLKKLTQNVSYIPHFISTVVMVGIINQVFNPFTGMWGSIQTLFGWNFRSDLRSNPDAFIHLYVWSGVWQGMGWGTIMYVAALSGVSPELHEAAKIDGASRLRRIFAVDLPAIIPTVCIMLILRFGSIISVGYEKIYLMQNTLNISESEVISTYTYKTGLGDNEFSYSSAIGMMNSVINTSMMILVNWITNKMSDGEHGLF